MKWKLWGKKMDKEAFIASMLLRDFKWVNSESLVDSLTRSGANNVDINALLRDTHVSLHIRMASELHFDHDSTPLTYSDALERIDYLIERYT